ncbi:hypothetical protein CW362_09270 [Streptomyces populi]|uniref:Uncharacterized protein n=1 Tax=Streptomyces populi TaxID=2058924 RepID=A0A2I0STR5_9ACTN|nr:hypothetical protein CW362_09270 [Streptomyces populi]
MAGLLLALGTPHLAAAEQDGPRSGRAVDGGAEVPGATFGLPGGSTNGTDRPPAFGERDRADRYVRSASASYDVVSTRPDVDGSVDLSVNEVTLRGKPGDNVKADFFFVNNGPAGTPAVFDDEEDNETAVVVDLTVPPGLTAVQVPDFCRGTKEGHEGKDVPNSSHYYCWQNRFDKGLTMYPGQFEHFPFVFRVDRADNRPGRIEISTSVHLDDSDPSNDSAAIEVDIVGAPAVPSAPRSGGSFTHPFIGGGIVAALALGGGALWLRRRSEASRTLRGESR